MTVGLLRKFLVDNQSLDGSVPVLTGAGCHSLRPVGFDIKYVEKAGRSQYYEYFDELNMIPGSTKVQAVVID